MKQSWWFYLVLLIFPLILLGVFFFVYHHFFSSPLVITGTSQAPLPLETPAPEEVIDPLRVLHLVLLGHGGANHDGGGLADTFIVAQIVPRAQTVNLFSLPRDLWIQLPFPARPGESELMHTKLNATLALGNSSQQYTHRPALYQGKNGGGALAKDIAAEIIGQPIDYYLAVDFSGFIKIIDLIAGQDGLRVTVPYSFIDDRYPIKGEENNLCDWSKEAVAALSATMSGDLLEKQFPCRYETLEFQAGAQVIPAATLLKFVRSRHSGVGGGDFGRSRRQQVVLEAVMSKLFSFATLPKLPELISQGLKLSQTDLDLNFIKQALLDYDDVTSFSLHSYVLDNQTYLQDARAGGGQYVLLPRAGQDNYTDVHAWVSDLLTQTLASATASASKL
jgi:anionic cell wall polymer biosynthesis LytR-Cps2A-Psr (LCP) family protein